MPGLNCAFSYLGAQMKRQWFLGRSGFLCSFSLFFHVCKCMQLHVYVKAEGQLQILASETPCTSIEDKKGHWHEAHQWGWTGQPGHKDPPVFAFPALGLKHSTIPRFFKWVLGSNSCPQPSSKSNFEVSVKHCLLGGGKVLLLLGADLLASSMSICLNNY